MTDTAPAQQAPQPPEWLKDETAFIAHVIKVCDSRAGRADLRTGTKPGALDAPWRMMPHVAKYLPRYRAEREASLAVAAWYATCAPSRRLGADLPPAWEPGRGNLGWSVGTGIGRKALVEVPAIGRLENITRQKHDPAAMRRALWPLVKQLAGSNIPVDWPWLLRDLKRWRSWHTDVTREWLFAAYDPRQHTLNTAPTTNNES